jgi:glucose uptake protein GlcU
VFVAVGFACGVWALRRAAHSGANARQRAGLLGAGAGVMFGLTAGLLKVVTNAIAAGQVLTLGFLVSFGCLVGAGVLGTAMNQRAYQIAPLSFSMPVVNVVDIVVAVLFGVLVFGEAPAHSPGLLLLQAGGLTVAVLGLRMIASLKSHGAASDCQLFEARR